MIRIPGALLALLTFPGIVIHEWAHKKFCDWFGVAVHKVVYFRLQNPFSPAPKIPGYVIHAEPPQFSQTFWISVGPLIINSALAIGFAFVAAEIERRPFLTIALYWIAVSAGAHAFPSNQDADNILQRSKRHLASGETILHYLSYPFYGLIWLANRSRRWWFDFLYAACLVYLGAHLHMMASGLAAMLLGRGRL